MSPFPPLPPANLDDLEPIRRHDWNAYSQLGEMHDHWDRPGWTPGRRSYHWLLTFSGATELQGLAEQCQRHLISGAFDPVPSHLLHVTLGRVAFTDEISRTVVESIADAADIRAKGLKPFRLEVGPLAGSVGALRFTVGPWTPLLALHRELAAATRAVLRDAAVMGTSTFRPHLSIAYANTTVPVAPLLARIEPLRMLPPVTTDITSASLVELRREDQTYSFKELRVVHLSMPSNRFI